MKEDTKKVITGELLSSEELLWYGQPDDKIRLTKFDLLYGINSFFVSFVVLFLFWNTGELRFIFPFFTFWMMLVALYGAYFRLLLKKANNRGFGYGITDQRIIIVHNMPFTKKRNCQNWPLSTVDKVTKRENKAVGTLFFEYLPFMSQIMMNSGFALGPCKVPAFYDLKDCDRVLDIFYEAKERLNENTTPRYNHTQSNSMISSGGFLIGAVLWKTSKP